MMRKRSSLLVILALALAIAGLYLLFAAQASTHELMLAAGFSVIALGMSVLAWRQMKLCFYPTPKHLIACWRLIGYVISRCWEISIILLRDLAGKPAGSFFRFTQFRPNTTREGDAQIILATAYTTAAPNFIVLGVDHDRLFFHQIERSDVPCMIDDLEAE